MKKIIALLFIAAFMVNANDAGAQQKKRYHDSVVFTKNTPNDVYIVMRPKKTRYSVPAVSDKSINDHTKGVMGQEEVVQNEKGQYANLNSNTGVYVPPNNGQIGLSDPGKR